MNNNTCPQCNTEITNAIYQCCRCFTKYCKDCEGSNEGRRCPKCGMGARMVLPPDKPREAVK